MKVEVLSIWAKYTGASLKVDAEPSRTDMGVLTSRAMAKKICTDSRGKVSEAIKGTAQEGDLMADIHKGYTIAKLSALKDKVEYENKLTLQWIQAPTINVLPGELKFEFRPYGQILDKRI